MSRKLNGDTLIEVLFAFAILSTVIGTAFSGAMGSYKSAQVAQQRSQAQLLAQYQADGLLTYRNSLAWDSASNLPNFLDGGSGLTAVSGFASFCMRAEANPNNPNGVNRPSDEKGFIVKVSWQPANATNSGQRETATRSVILTDK